MEPQFPIGSFTAVRLVLCLLCNRRPAAVAGAVVSVHVYPLKREGIVVSVRQRPRSEGVEIVPLGANQNTARPVVSEFVVGGIPAPTKHVLPRVMKTRPRRAVRASQVAQHLLIGGAPARRRLAVS